jgi:rhodanese-related sulfurtransferase
MPKSVDAAAVERLMAEGAQLVEVLPPEEFAEVHLPRARATFRSRDWEPTPRRISTVVAR